MKILMAASECVPFVKTGGLADVLGALPKALAAQGEDVRVVLPLYAEIPEDYKQQMTQKCVFYVDLGWRHQYCGVKELTLAGVTYYFIDNEYYFNRPYVYGLGGDEGERFAFFSRAVLEMLPRLNYFPDVLHCHDWQTGLIPMMLRTQYNRRSEYTAIKTVYTIHNLQYQGVFPIGEIEDLLHLGSEAYLDGGVEFYGQCSFMKGGINFADRITTVSPSYAQEIRSRGRSADRPELHRPLHRPQKEEQDGASGRAGPQGGRRGAADRHGGPPVRPEGAGSALLRARRHHEDRRAAGGAG